MQYTVWIVSPPNYRHSLCFSEVALSMRDGLRELGHGAEITTTPPLPDSHVIILGAHLLHPVDMLIFPNPVIWQLEQIPDNEEDWRAGTLVHQMYIESLKRAEVWDYSERNIGILAKLGVEAKICPIGYMPCLTRIENCIKPDIDVLHIGSLNERRSSILQQLMGLGYKVHHAFDCYGAQRDALISRSKIVINIHYYESKVFEIVRCSYMMSNRKCVVSETGSGDLEDACAYADYGQLVGRCVNLLASDVDRENVAQKGFKIFSGLRQGAYLEPLVGRA